MVGSSNPCVEAVKPLEAGSTTVDITIGLNNNCLLGFKCRSDRVNHMTCMGEVELE